jgi:4-hydroxybenzoate polyprenyltransferase
MSETAAEPLASNELSHPEALSRPLAVALDGALVQTDTIWERVIQLLRRRPWLIFLLPFWALAGRARLDRIVDKRVPVDAAHLPYRKTLVDFLRDSAAKGRRLFLVVAGGDPALADQVARHLDLFQETIKRSELTPERFPDGFDYVAAVGDLPTLARAQQGYLVGADSAAVEQARPYGDKVKVLSRRPSRLRALVKVLRPHQWAKNALVVIPVLLAPALPTLHQMWLAFLAMAAFSLCASAGYVFNDLMDLAADRVHPSKHRRPFASGALPIVYGPPLLLLLVGGSFGISLTFLPLPFTGMLAAYFAATLIYSFVVKSKLMADVVLLAWLYTHRVLAGGIATSVPISAWLLAFSMFMFLSLAFAKRYIELRQSLKKGGQLKSRGYHTHDLEMVASMGPTAGYMSILVLCLYVESDAVKVNYHNPWLLWFISPVLLYWVSRVWFLAHRGKLEDDPVKFALTDRHSWLSVAAIALIAGVARFWER